MQSDVSLVRSIEGPLELGRLLSVRHSSTEASQVLSAGFADWLRCQVAAGLLVSTPTIRAVGRPRQCGRTWAQRHFGLWDNVAPPPPITGVSVMPDPAALRAGDLVGLASCRTVVEAPQSMQGGAVW